MGHVISFLGFALRLNWAWLFRVRKKAEDGRAVGLWPGFDDFSVFRVQHHSARHNRNRAYCYSILRQTVTDAKLILSHDEHVGTYEARAVSVGFPRALEIRRRRLLPRLSLKVSVVEEHAAPLLILTGAQEH